MRILVCCFLAAVFLFLIPFPVKAALPTGFLDVASVTNIAGWAKDNDYGGSIRVHIYIDGKFAKDILANSPRQDLGGNYGFNWANPPLHPGVREIRAYALGVNSSGQMDGQNFELNLSPKFIEVPRYYTLRSPDGGSEFQIDALMGGIISRIEDRVYLPGYNMVISHGGAAMQKAFWYPIPYPTLPPGCPSNRDDVKFPNPTQGGYYADAVAGTNKGNPIGIFGTNGDPDHNEFIRFEDNNQTIHFKTRFINHSYCLQPEADMANMSLWDVPWYLEQWVRFDPGLSNTVRVDSNISYVGSVTQGMDTRQSIAFTRGLNRVAYQSGSSTVITNSISNISMFYPTNYWTAALHPTVNSGFGFILPSSAQAFHFSSLTNGLFNYDSIDDPTYPRLWFDRNGHIKLETIGSLSSAYTNNGGATYNFNPGGNWNYRFYIPVGPVERIRAQAATLMPTPTPTPTKTPTPTPTKIPTPTPTIAPSPTIKPILIGDYTGDGRVDYRDYQYVKDRFVSFGLSIFNFNLVVKDYGK